MISELPEVPGSFSGKHLYTRDASIVDSIVDRLGIRSAFETQKRALEGSGGGPRSSIVEIENGVACFVLWLFAGMANNATMLLIGTGDLREMVKDVVMENVVNFTNRGGRFFRFQKNTTNKEG